MSFGNNLRDCQAKINRWLSYENILLEHKRQYQNWFTKIPQFSCSDKFLEKMWYYRWFLLRYNLSYPQTERLKYHCFYEGKHNFWFARLIILSAPHQLADVQWYNDPIYYEEELLNIIENQKYSIENGYDDLFPSIKSQPDSMKMSTLIHFLAWSAWEGYLIHQNREFLEKIIPYLVREIKACLRHFDPDEDGLPTCYEHALTTGMEFQPSWYYFTGFPKDVDVTSKNTTPLERVDMAVYTYLSAKAVSHISSLLGRNEQADEFSQLADKVKQGIRNKMWDEETNFFYDLNAETEEKALVKNNVGFIPFMTDIADEEHIKVFEHLIDRNKFWTRFPIPSVAKDCPAYRPDNTWFGDKIHGCMWNGPTWPLSNGLLALCLGNAVRKHDRKLSSVFAEFLRRYTKLMFRGQKLEHPCVVEHYNPETGAPHSTQDDYLHSLYIDIIVKYVSGLVLREDEKIEIDPIDCELESFTISNLRYKGYDLTITWDEEKGMEFYVNKEKIFESDHLSHTIYDPSNKEVESLS